MLIGMPASDGFLFAVGVTVAVVPEGLHDAADQLPPGSRVLLIAAGAGVTAGAALYRKNPAGS